MATMTALAFLMTASVVAPCRKEPRPGPTVVEYKKGLMMACVMPHHAPDRMGSSLRERTEPTGQRAVGRYMRETSQGGWMRPMAAPMVGWKAPAG